MTDAGGVLLFGGVVLVAEIAVLAIRRKGWGPVSFRLVVLTLVVIAGLYVAVIDLDADARAPVYGLLGVVAGYAAGKETKQEV